MAERRSDYNPRDGAVLGARTVVSDYASMVVGRMGSAALSVISVVITTRILSPRGYGTLAYFNILSLLVFTISSAWTGTAVARYAREQLELRGTMRAVTWSRLAITAPLLTVSAIVVVALEATNTLPSGFGWAFVAVALIYGTTWILSDHLIYLLEAIGRMKTSAVCLTAAQAGMLGALGVILLVGIAPSALTIAYLTLGASVAVNAALIPILWRKGMWPPVGDRATLRRMLRLSIPLIAFTVSQYVVQSIDLIIIGAFRSRTDVGVYAVAYQGFTALVAVTLAAPPVLTPLFVSLRASGRGEVIRRYLDRVVFQLCFVAAILAGLAAPFVSPAVSLVFGPAFHGAAEPLTVLLAAVVLLFGGSLLAPALVLNERGRAIAGYNLAAAIANVILDVAVIGVLGVGIVGAALATTVAMGTIFVGYTYVARRDAGLGFELRPTLFGPAVTGVVAALLVRGALGVGISLLATMAVTLVIVRSQRPFGKEDAEVIGALDIPHGLRRVVLRGLALAAR